MTNAERHLAAVQRGIDLFNAGEIDALFADVFDPDVDYAGDPDRNDGPGRVTGSTYMVGLFHLAWVLDGERWRFMAVKLHPEAAKQARRDWQQAAAA
ncbi:MAG TPA: hypothetical protein VH231_15425 [Solirubrobacteraceae bacterium]|nr:hypothetical protein [Solirubrobacteraceae bacterium]